MVLSGTLASPCKHLVVQVSESDVGNHYSRQKVPSSVLEQMLYLQKISQFHSFTKHLGQQYWQKWLPPIGESCEVGESKVGGLKSPRKLHG